MTQAGSQAWQFYRDVTALQEVWTVRDDKGFPSPKTSSGQRAQPFWSTKHRAEKVISEVLAYRAFVPFRVSWRDFCEKWVPGLEADGILVGVNWSGARALGYDLPPRDVQRNVEAIFGSSNGLSQSAP